MPCSSTIQIQKEENILRMMCSFIIPHNPHNYIAETLNINILLNKLEMYFFSKHSRVGKCANTKVTFIIITFVLKNAIEKPNAVSLVNTYIHKEIENILKVFKKGALIIILFSIFPISYKL